MNISCFLFFSSDSLPFLNSDFVFSYSFSFLVQICSDGIAFFFGDLAPCVTQANILNHGKSCY